MKATLKNMLVGALSTALFLTVTAGTGYAFGNMFFQPAQASPITQGVTPNPNQARVLNDSRVRIAGRLYAQVTTEAVPNVICTTIVLVDNNYTEHVRPSISCVRY